MSKNTALVVLSGGQDSTTCLFWAKEHFDEVSAITFDYGQHHRIEIAAACKVAALAGIADRHEIVLVPDILKSASPLTNGGAELERYADHDQMEAVIGNRVEKTFVPMRNTFFLTVAMNRAVAQGCNNLVTGICQADNANYPDCTETFRDKFENMANESLGTYDRLNGADLFRVWAPLMNLSKCQSIELAMRIPGAYAALAYSHTSYDGKYPPTDKNHANVLRAHGFEEAGVPDPLVIRAYREGLMGLPESRNYDEYSLTDKLPASA
jgi:7-cyano-7-deazaguanine synthase